MRETGGRVASGPFRGMRYLNRSMEGAVCPKILGTYEKELWPILGEVLEGNYQTMINVGCAEGYYAVGLAVRLPAARMVCFEAQTSKHHLIRELARHNAVEDRLDVRGICTLPLLRDCLRTAQNPVILCDIEGNERDLLDPASIPQLVETDLLVELHDRIVPGVSEHVRRQFEDTHEIVAISTRPRTQLDWPESVKTSSRHWRECLTEAREGPMQWFWMRSRKRLTNS